jgi:hypothetical protein
MNTKELRDETRFSMSQKPKGMLFLHVKGGCLPILSIRDISQAGISVLIDYEVNKGDHVDIEYKDRDNEVKVSGIVVWRKQVEKFPNEPEGLSKNLLGISMFNPNILLSFMLIE